MKTIEEVREIFSKDRFATENYAVIEEIGEKYAKCSMEIKDRHKNAMGGVMGGAAFTLADFAFAVATNWEVMNTVSISSNIAYIGVPKGRKIIAEAHMIKDVTITGLHKG